MLRLISLGKDVAVRTDIGGERGIKVGLGESGLSAINCLDCLRIRNRDFVRCDPDEWTKFLMKSPLGVLYLPSSDGRTDPKTREGGEKRARNVRKGVEESAVKDPAHFEKQEGGRKATQEGCREKTRAAVEDVGKSSKRHLLERILNCCP